MTSLPSFQHRLGAGLGKIIVALLLGGPLFNVHGLLQSVPEIIQILFIFAIGAYIVRSLLCFKRWNDELQHVGKFVKATLLLLAVVIVENFCTWYVEKCVTNPHQNAIQMFCIINKELKYKHPPTWP